MAISPASLPGRPSAASIAHVSVTAAVRGAAVKPRGLRRRQVGAGEVGYNFEDIECA